MPKRPEPVGVPKGAPTAYERDLRQRLVDPILERIRRSFATLDDLTPIDVVRQRATAEILAAAGVLDRIARTSASEHVRRVSEWHRRRFLATFRRIGLDLEPLMSPDLMRASLTGRIGDNVALIKTIPARMHLSLERRLIALSKDGYRFDPEMLERVLRAEYNSSGWNVRRLTRDQTTKQIGQMTQIRLTQAGFERYTWVTGGSGPNRRKEHQANNGKVFPLGVPPPTGHPGEAILCMCQAVAYVEDVDIAAGIASISAV